MKPLITLCRLYFSYFFITRFYISIEIFLSKKKFISNCIFFFFLFTQIVYPQEVSESKKQEFEFLRISEGSLQTAVYTLEHPQSFVRVKLIGLIHVGEAKYYKNVAKLTNEADYVFYEGIRLEQSTANYSHIQLVSQVMNSPPKKSIQNIVNFQSEFAKYFNLVEQGDYLKPKPNWINADVNFSDFIQILKNLNVSLEQISKTLTLESKVSMDQDIAPEDLIQFEDTRAVAMLKFKRRMAKYLVKSARELCYDENMKIPREVIILERNRVALEYMSEKLTSNLPLELGVLYGAAHIPNFLEVLTEKYKFQIQSIIWLDAWRLDSN